MQALRLLKAAYDRGINTVRWHICSSLNEPLLPRRGMRKLLLSVVLAVGYRQRVLQRRVGEDHRQGPEEVWHPATKGHHHDKVLPRGLRSGGL